MWAALQTAHIDVIGLLTTFALAAFVGYEVISKVPSILHTPLMSGTNAIHGVILVGSMLILSDARGDLQLALGFIAVVLATLNVVGGFAVTDRMLEMFKSSSRRQKTLAERSEDRASSTAPHKEKEEVAAR